jgi:1-aminocyclopropane-1-carboxylate deaminase
MNDVQHQRLKAALDCIPQADYPVHSRIHSLKTILNCYIKRDDELGFGFNGSKARKFRTLIPHLLHNGIKDAIIIGSANSNNVLSLSQLCIENQINTHLFLKQYHDNHSKGNFLLTRLITSPSKIHWLTSENWPKVSREAEDYLKTLIAPAIVIPEGSALPIAMLGSLSLAFDIIENEQQHNIYFDHIFIDAGTGLTAIALILAYAYLQKKTMIHVVLIAGSTQTFYGTLKEYHHFFTHWLNEPSLLPQNYTLHHPVTAKSFGSVNTSILSEIHSIASQEGILVDPIYSAKLFATAKNIIKTINNPGSSLLIHSGGALSLNGYQTPIDHYLLRTHAS